MSDTDRVRARAELLGLRAIERGIEVTADGRCSEAGLGRLLGIDGEYLARLRAEGDAPPFYRLPAGPRTRISYDLLQAAEWVEGFRECPTCRRRALDR